jgi:hypothetical protein
MPTRRAPFLDHWKRAEPVSREYIPSFSQRRLGTDRDRRRTHRIFRFHCLRNSSAAAEDRSMTWTHRDSSNGRQERDRVAAGQYPPARGAEGAPFGATGWDDRPRGQEDGGP